MNLGLDFDDPNYVQINNEAVKPFENKLKQLYAEQNKLYKQASNLKTIPQDLRKKIEFNNLPVDLSIAFLSTSLISRIFKYFSAGLLPSRS